MPLNSFWGDLRGHHCFYGITKRATMAAETVQQLLEFGWFSAISVSRMMWHRDFCPPDRASAVGTGSACVLQIKTIQMQAPGITSWRILSNRLCFHALFIHIYISVKMASFELIDAFLGVFVRNQYCTSPGLCYICSFVSSQVPNNYKFSYLRQINCK